MVSLFEKAQQCIQDLSSALDVNLNSPPRRDAEPPVKLLVVGQPTQNLFGVLDELVGGLESLNRMILRGYHCAILNGENGKYSIIKNGDRIRTSEEDFAEKLSELSVSPEMIQCEIETDCPLTQNVSLDIIASSEDYEDINWDALLRQYDYCLFTLSSTALLSMAERKVLRQHIIPNMKDCLGVLLTQDSLISDDDRVDIDALLSSFFKESVNIYRLPEIDADGVRALLGNLPSSLIELRKKREDRATAIVLKQLVKLAETRIEALGSNSNQLEEAIQMMSEKAKLLPSRQEATCRRARMQYIANIKIELNESVSAFTQALIDKLRDEIEASDDIDDLQSILPRYIADQWNTEMEHIKLRIEDVLCDMNNGMTDYIAKDIREYIQDGSNKKLSDYLLSVVDVYGTKVTDQSKFHYQEANGDSKLKRYGAIASGVALVLMSHPVIGIAVAVFGTKFIKKEGKQKLLQDNKQALISAAVNMSREASDEATSVLSGTFASIESKLAAGIEDAYQRIMDMMAQALNLKKQDRSAHEDQIAALSKLKAEAEQLLTEA